VPISTEIGVEVRKEATALPTAKQVAAVPRITFLVDIIVKFISETISPTLDYSGGRHTFLILYTGIRFLIFGSFHCFYSINRGSFVLLPV